MPSFKHLVPLLLRTAAVLAVLEYSLLVANANAYAQPSAVTVTATLDLDVGAAQVYSFSHCAELVIADNTVVATSPVGAINGQRAFLLKGVHRGVTTVVATKTDPNERPDVFTVRVRHAGARILEMETLIAESFPGARVTLKATGDTAALAVRGTVPNAETAKQIMALIESSSAVADKAVECLTVNSTSGTCYVPQRCGGGRRR